jgi:hypothetical protein
MNECTPIRIGKTGSSPNLDEGMATTLPYCRCHHFVSQLTEIPLLRVACLWFLVDRVVCAKTGTPCESTQRFLALPLPSHKSIWEANTPTVWQSEYDVRGTIYSRDLSRFGDLIDAHKRAGDITHARKLDAWNAGADSLGILLNIATAMI